MTDFTTRINARIFPGFLGLFLFGSRFFVQWIVSERRDESIITAVF